MRFRVKEHLGKLIQAGGAAVGHSSVEDSKATLDLVRFFVMNERKAHGRTPAPAMDSTAVVSVG